MKIAYVALHLERTIMGGGVGHKIQTQLHLWQELGHEARLFLHSPDALDFPTHLATVFQYPPVAGPAAVRLPRREWRRSLALNRLVHAVAEYRPDVIYLRYGMYALPLQNLFKIAPVVVEINTNDVDEYRYRGMSYYFLNRLGRRQILGRAAGMVFLSRELAGLPNNQMFQKPAVVIANGIDFNEYRPLPAPQNERPCLAMVATPGYAWHGVEKLVGLAQHFPELDVEVVGYGPEDLPAGIPGNLHLHGYLPHAAIQQVLRRVDVACGTFSLYKKNMKEASPLKVREALGWGIPVLIGYTDTDLSGKDLEFILEIPNREGNVSGNAAQIMAFIRKMQGQRADRQRLIPLIDQRPKEEKRLHFLMQITS